MSQCPAAVPLSEARKNPAPNKALPFIASVQDRQAIDDFCADRKSRQVARGLHEGLRLLGRTCIQVHSPQQLHRKQALGALGQSNSPPTARRYLDMLQQAGVVSIHGDVVRLTYWDALHPGRSDPFWEQRAAHQRRVSARSSAKCRAKAAAAKGKLFSEAPSQVAENTDTNSPVTSLFLKAPRAETKTKSTAGALTQAAFALPTALLDPAKAAAPMPILATPQQAAVPVVVRTRAPQKPVPPPPSAADIDAVDALSGEPAPEVDFFARARAITAAGGWSEAEVDALRERDAAATPVQQGTPTEQAKQEAPAAPMPAETPTKATDSSPATLPQVRELVANHARLLEGHEVNLLAVCNTGAPRDMVRESLDLLAEGLRGTALGHRKRINNPGGWLVQTIRKKQRGVQW